MGFSIRWVDLVRFAVIVHWKGRFSTSTGQAETYALASLLKDVVWTRHLADDMRRPQMNATELDTAIIKEFISNLLRLLTMPLPSTSGCLKPSSADLKERMALFMLIRLELMIIILIFSRRRYVLNCSANIAMSRCGDGARAS